MASVADLALSRVKRVLRVNLAVTLLILEGRGKIDPSLEVNQPSRPRNASVNSFAICSDVGF